MDHAFSIRNKPFLSLSQDQLFMNVYYTCLKALWDELQNYWHLSNCTCRALSTLVSYQQQQFILHVYFVEDQYIATYMCVMDMCSSKVLDHELETSQIDLLYECEM